MVIIFFNLMNCEVKTIYTLDLPIMKSTLSKCQCVCMNHYKFVLPGVIYFHK